MRLRPLSEPLAQKVQLLREGLLLGHLLLGTFLGYSRLDGLFLPLVAVFEAFTFGDFF